jgi:hypothetical protein
MTETDHLPGSLGPARLLEQWWAHVLALAERITTATSFQTVRRDSSDGRITYMVLAWTGRECREVAFVEGSRHDAEFIAAMFAQAPLLKQLAAAPVVPPSSEPTMCSSEEGQIRRLADRLERAWIEGGSVVTHADDLKLAADKIRAMLAALKVAVVPPSPSPKIGESLGLSGNIVVVPGVNSPIGAQHHHFVPSSSDPDICETCGDWPPLAASPAGAQDVNTLQSEADGRNRAAHPAEPAVIKQSPRSMARRTNPQPVDAQAENAGSDEPATRGVGLQSIASPAGAPPPTQMVLTDEERALAQHNAPTVVALAHRWMDRQLEGEECKICGSREGEDHEPSDTCGIVCNLLRVMAAGAPPPGRNQP